MKTLEYIKLDGTKTEILVEMLQQLLADYQIYYSNVRGIHWNIRGQSFFTLHKQFEDMYTDAANKADEIAERILMLGGIPANKFSDYLAQAKVREVDGITSGNEAMKNLLQSYKILMRQERSILIAASEAGDEATVDIMTSYLREQEKMVWMMTAFMS